MRMSMKFNGSERKIRETLLRMDEGYVLDFSNRTMENLFQENFEIEMYNLNYNRENLYYYNANRQLTIWKD